jgi:hypothetical protein
LAVCLVGSRGHTINAVYPCELQTTITLLRRQIVARLICGEWSGIGICRPLFRINQNVVRSSPPGINFLRKVGAYLAENEAGVLPILESDRKNWPA